MKKSFIRIKKKFNYVQLNGRFYAVNKKDPTKVGRRVSADKWDRVLTRYQASKFIYKDSKGRRITKLKYYSAIKKKSKSVASIQKIKKRYVQGKNYIKATRVSFGNYGESYAVEKITDFYNSVSRRFSRGVRGVGYIQITGFLVQNDGTRLYFQRATPRAFLNELKGDVLFEKVSELVRQILSYLGESKYKADDFVMTKMSVNVRKDK